MDGKRKVFPETLRKYEKKIGTTLYSHNEMCNFLEESSKAYRIVMEVAYDEEALKKLAKHENGFIRAHVARREATPVETLKELARDISIWVRCKVAENPKTPLETLLKLAKNSTIRPSVALNASLPVEYLIEFSKDSNMEVRYSVATNSNTPIETLILLTEDKSDLVKQIATVMLKKKEKEA